ncbi:transcription termination/antitermination NusG family protein [Pseudomonas profundi]|uniref:transcription termination/antitermination NusG family protein n=2 Tax=Pseudomonas profundi TaxID=1981513 RepID=UPI00123C3750
MFAVCASRLGGLMNNHREMPEVAWYLLQRKPRQVGRAGEHRAHQGFECLEPSLRVDELHAGKVKRIAQPMFPGYLFARIKAQDNWTALPLTRCVSRVLNTRGQSVPLRARRRGLVASATQRHGASGSTFAWTGQRADDKHDQQDGRTFCSVLI